MKIPYPPGTVPAEVRGYLVNLVKAITNNTASAVRTNEAVGSILLASPNGSVYTVAVTDTGTLTTTLVYDAP